MKEKNINVIIPFRNVKHFIADCLYSVESQQYSNYKIYLLDDASTDGTLDLIEDQNHIVKVRNPQRLGPTENIFNALNSFNFKDDDIILWLDGDDYLFGKYVFQQVNYNYNEGALITYGQYVTDFGQLGFCSPYTFLEYKNLRTSSWKSSHLKTFSYSLFKKFLKIDPSASHLKDENGSFFMATSDMAFMFPLLEIAQYENISFISNILYVYRQHPSNDHSNLTGIELQKKAANCIRNKKKLRI